VVLDGWPVTTREACLRFRAGEVARKNGPAENPRLSRGLKRVASVPATRSGCPERLG
jgi:hypothetical protein